MITPHDELLVHQLTTTFDHVVQSDLRWTERIVMFGFDRDTGTSIMTGLARYPNRNLVDAYVMITIDGTAHVVRLSRELTAEPEQITSWTVGPYTYSVTEPLRRVAACLEPTDEHPISLDISFEGLYEPYEQTPAFHRSRGRVREDARRFYQVGDVSGSFTVNGQRIEIDPSRWYFGRDHSWGVRQGGGGGNLPEGDVLQPSEVPEGVFYAMGIFDFGDRLVHFAQREDHAGAIWQYEGEILYPIADGRPPLHLNRTEHDLTFRDDLRIVSGGQVTVHGADGSTDTVTIQPRVEFWPGFAGYDDYRGYASGFWKGESWSDNFTVDVTDIEHVRPVSMLTETFCEVTCDGKTGHGVLEMVFVGVNEHYGYTSW